MTKNIAPAIASVLNDERVQAIYAERFDILYYSMEADTKDKMLDALKEQRDAGLKIKASKAILALALQLYWWNTQEL